MISKCPGQDDRNVRAELVRCPACGYEAEIFSDEMRAVCPGCGGAVSRTRLPSCVDWCAGARGCLGEEKYKQLKGG